MSTSRQCILGRPKSDFAANVIQANTLAACNLPLSAALGVVDVKLLAPTTEFAGGALVIITPTGEFTIPLPAPMVPRATGLLTGGTADLFITSGSITPFADGNGIPVASAAPTTSVLDTTRHAFATAYAQPKTLTNLAGTLRITLTAALLADASATIELRLVSEPAAPAGPPAGFSVLPGTTLTATFALTAPLALGTAFEVPFVGTITPTAIAAGDRVAVEAVITATAGTFAGLANFSIAASYNAA